MALAEKRDFEGLDRLTHLAAGSDTPPLVSQGDAFGRWVAQKGQGPAGTALRDATMARVRANAAALFGVTPEEIAFASSAGEAMSQIALSLPLTEGDNVVLQDIEFRSASLPWIGLTRLGVEVRAVNHHEWTPDEAAFRAAIDQNTQVIVTSQVNYLTGVQHNLAALRQMADRAGALLVSDATHALGAVAVPGRLCDFTVSATNKWQLGCQGVALIAWNRERLAEVAPAICGWRSVEDWDGTGNPLDISWKRTAERLEPGSPPWPAIFYLDDGLAYLCERGVDQISAHVAALSGEVNARLRSLGYDVATPAEAAFRAGNTCFWIDDPEAIAARLYRIHRVLVAGYSRRLRVSTHLYNDQDDIERLFAALELELGARALG